MPFSITNGLCSLDDVKAALRITDTDDDDRIALAIDAASRDIETDCNRRFWIDPVPRSDTCTLNSTATVTDATITAADVGRSVTGTGIPANCIVGTVTAGVSFQLANFEGTPQSATVSGSESLTIGYSPRRFVSNDPWLVECDDFVGAPALVESDYAGDGTFSTVWQPADYQLEPVNGIMEGQAGWPTTAIRAIRSLYFPVWGGIAYPRPYTQALVQITAQWGWTSVPTPIRQAAVVQSIAVFKGADVPFGATAFGEAGILHLHTSLHPMAELLIGPYRQQEVLVA
jgi:hypothetical protein